MQLQRSCCSTLRWLILFSLDLMRCLAIIGVATLLVSCATRGWTPIAPSHTTYYDRNGDGVVDYELTVLGSDDANANSALVDTKFRGRYDVLIHWGHVV